MKRIVPVILLLAGLMTGCSTVQYTNRQSLMLISADQEVALGASGFKETISKAKVSGDTVKCDLIKKVGQRIAAVADRPDFKWEYVLVDDPKTVNAVCLPGGKVIFYTGILPICRDENGIATVMAHEVAHAIARHGAERVSQQLATNVVGEMLASAVSGKSAATQKSVLIGYGLASQFGVLLPYSRTHELEADHIGLILMAKAGYDPRQAVDFWQRMAAQGANKAVPEFLSTHPADAKRIETIKKELPEALTYYKGAPSGTGTAPSAKAPAATAATLLAANTSAPKKALPVAPKALPAD
ncbi:MAG TPA: M48 family metallopeptidase [bacterium]|nr:M48 family metallopeptidase [bacterium]